MRAVCIFSKRRFAGVMVISFTLRAMTPADVWAASLSAKDYQYLQTNFGFSKSSFTLTNASRQDAARLHDVIDEAIFKDYTSLRALNVGDVLFGVERRTCQDWELAHGNSLCPDVADARFMPGWQVADRKCVACHLTGTTEAPSFFKLSNAGSLNESHLAAALARGHAMSPIALSQQELHDLVLYINSWH